MISEKDKQIIEKVENTISTISGDREGKAAYILYKDLNGFLAKSDLQYSNLELYKRFFNALMKLKFLSLNFFNDWEEIGNLIKNSLDKIFDLEDYDIWNKIETNLLAIDDLDERDEIKKELVKKLSESEDVIIAKSNYPNNPKLPLTVAGWIKDININVGYKNISSFEKTKYLTNSSNTILLNAEDKGKIKILFELYDRLKLSSKTPQGYEDDVPVEVNGVTYIFSRGQMKPLKDVFKYTKDISGPPQSETEKNVASLEAQKQASQGIASKVIDEEIDNTKKIEDLQIMANKYKDNSLQKRAIEEEIRKLAQK
jgi:hypothetical protein